MHLHALRRNAADGAWFACVSEATRQDLVSVLPQIEPRTVTIPNMISPQFSFEEAPATRVPEIVWSRKNRNAPHEGGAPIDAADLADGQWPYLLMVSTIEPRKNHLALLDAWELLRANGHPHLNLVCVGGLGWEHEAITQRFSPWLRRGGLHLLANVPTADLRLLYRHALATVCPSLGEGFDFAGVEAMRSGGVVCASDIRVHRDVYADACEYFNAYSAQDMAAAMARVIADDAGPRRAQLRAEGDRVAARYMPERVLPQWHEFLARLAR
jgi:glycosyltransferase involved in cell wall biosynthesis